MSVESAAIAFFRRQSAAGLANGAGAVAGNTGGYLARIEADLAKGLKLTSIQKTQLRMAEFQAVAQDFELQRMQFELIQMMAPPIARAFERHFTPYAEQSIAAWPVNTGYSKSEFFVTFDARKGQAKAMLGNTASYVFYVKFGKQKVYRGPPTHEDYVQLGGKGAVRARIHWTRARDGSRLYYEYSHQRTDGNTVGKNVWATTIRSRLGAVSRVIADDIRNGV
jgi:hypothetical protein